MKFSLKTLLVLSLFASMTGCAWKAEEKDKDADEMEMDGAEQAARQEFLMLRDPQLNIIPNERLELARQQMHAMQSNARTLAALSWHERGPNNVGGRTRAIIIDKRDATGNTVFAGSVSGGIFKTTNFLSDPPTWSPINDQMSNLVITAMVQNKNSPNIMYAGTGEGWLNIDALRGGGIFKTIDGGETWTLLANTASFEYVQDLAIDNNGNVYASLRNSTTTFRGVQRSTDGGTTWTQVLGAPLGTFATGRAADLEVASNGDIYATLGVFSKTAVLKSSFAVNGANTGALNTWTEITPVHTTPTQRGELAVAPSNPQRLYLLMQDSASYQVKTLYRSSDAGATWDSLPAPSALNNGAVSQNWYNLIAVVDPANPDKLVVGGYHIARSSDAGNNFDDITGSNVHVDEHMLLYNGAAGLVVGNDGGIYYTPDVNVTNPVFANKNNGYNVTQFYGVDYHPSNVNYYLAGAQDNNTQKFIAAGVNTTSVATGGDGGVPHIDKQNPLFQFTATTGNNFYRSLNGGSTFSYLSSVSNSRGLFINPTDYDENTKSLYSSDDAGKYYYITGLDATPTGGATALGDIGTTRQITAVKVDPTTSNTVWMVASAATASVQPIIVKVVNANSPSPSTTVVTTINVTAGAYVSCVDVDPANGNHLLVTVSNYGVVSVLESTDGGNSFHTIEGNLPDMPVYWGIFAPATAQLNGTTGGNGGIILGTELGVWTTSAINGSSTVWIANNSGFPNVRTDMLKLRTSDMTLIAATHGRGLFTATVPTDVTGVNTVSNTRNFINFTTVDAQNLFIRIGNLNVQKMQIRIFDVNGRLVKSSDATYTDQNVGVSTLPRGSYILKIYGTRGEQYTRHFVK